MRKSPLQFNSWARGFTLLEMVITLGVFILLTAAVFGIITSVLKGTSTLHDNQNRRDQSAALNAYLKQKLGNLPAASNLVSYRRGDGEGLAQNGIIFGNAHQVIVIDAKPQPNGYYTLRLDSATSNDLPPSGNSLADTIKQSMSMDNANFEWLPLIRDVKILQWKFQDWNTGQWSDQWDNSSAKPNLVELTIQQAGDLQPVTMDFWLPQLTPVALVNAAQAGASATSQNQPIIPHAP